MTTVFRFRYKVQGGHTHVRVFAGKSFNGTLGKAGDLAFRNEEWEDFLAMTERNPAFFSVIDETKDEVA